MPSTLAWLDHDAAERDRVKRILALFQERTTVDQLGFGGIRDSFADLLFPGTSTIQTRLRYMLFVPWIYTRLEQDQVPANRFGAVARENELALVEPLISAREEGVFGRMAGGGLKRLPSEVYWNGLGVWGIRRFLGSREQYHHAVDEVYRRRRLLRQLRADGGEPDGLLTWHPELPSPPPSFPDEILMGLGQEEAEFLRDRIVASQPDSLLAFLALHPVRIEVRYPWMHPLLALMPPQHRRILEHARLFSEVTEGARILFNLMLAETAARVELIEEHRTGFADWAETLDPLAIDEWSLNDLWRVVRNQGHTITPQAKDFVHRWVAHVRSGAESIPSNEEARRLIRHREMLLKGPRSFFRNPRALEERWGGYAGIGRLNYRWENVQRLLGDLYAGLEGS